MADRTIALVDCNNFFVSCERALNPALNGQPVIVLSNNDGCIISRSNEAKALGFPMGAPIHQFKALVKAHQVHLFSPNFRWYTHVSSEIQKLLAQETELLEMYSVDEAFLDISALPFSDLEDFGRHVQQKIITALGVPVSVGIAETKTLAKSAIHLAKMHPEAQGVVSLYQSPHRRRALSKIPIHEVWGVGRKLSARLRALEASHAVHLAQWDPQWVKQQFGVPLMRTALELQGVMCYPVEIAHNPQKSLIFSRSFGKRVTSKATMQQIVATYTRKVVDKLRRQNLATQQLTLSIRTNRFQSMPQYRADKTITLPVASNIATEIIGYALTALESIFRPQFQYHKAGIMLSDLVPEESVQTSLLDTVPRQKWQQVGQTLDKLADRFGWQSIHPAVEGQDTKQWQMRQNHLSVQHSQGLEDRLFAVTGAHHPRFL